MMRATLLSCALSLTLLAGVAGAEPQLGPGTYYLSWNSCLNTASSRNLDFAGPGIYRQILVGRDLGRAIVGLRLVLDVETMATGCYTKPDFPDAWRFDPGGCQSGKLSVSASGFSPHCPGLEATNRLDWVNVAYHDPSAWKDMQIEVISAFDAFHPNPVQSYTLAQLVYDLRAADAGPGAPSRPCGGADVPMCLTVRSMELTFAGGETATLSNYSACYAWQWYSDCWCGYCDPILDSTWGKVKALYR